MDELLLNSNIKLNFLELISYFSIELICVLGIILNIILAFYITKNIKLKRLSDLITCIIFCINSSILTTFVFLQNENFSIGGDLIVFNKMTFFLKLFINLFALFFVITTYKFTRKSKYKVPIINSILISIILLSGLIFSSDNFTFIYIALEGIIILVYKYASVLSSTRKSPYSITYITISFSATILFVTFYFLDYFVNDLLQTSIMQSCMILSLLLKIGLFPVFNYSIDKNYRSNISYSILTFCMLPIVGTMACSKIMSSCMYNEVYQISTSIFIAVCAISSSILCYKAKNIGKYIINIGQIYFSFFILNTMITSDYNPYFIIIVSGIILTLYSMMRAYKNSSKMTLLFSFFIILSSLLIPIFGTDALVHIYAYDKTGFILMNVFALCNILIIIKALKIIENFYKNKIKLNI